MRYTLADVLGDLIWHAQQASSLPDPLVGDFPVSEDARHMEAATDELVLRHVLNQYRENCRPTSRILELLELPRVKEAVQRQATLGDLARFEVVTNDLRVSPDFARKALGALSR